MPSCSASLLSAALLAATSAQPQWPMHQGGPRRLGLGPSVISAMESHISAGSAAPPEPGPLSSAPLSPPLSVPPPASVTGLQFQFNSGFHFAKTPAPIILADGSVLAVSDDCIMVNLPAPDTTTGGWALPTFAVQIAPASQQPHCSDPVVDGNNIIYVPVCLLLQDCFIYAYRVTNGNPTLVYPAVSLLGSLRVIEVYNLGMLTYDGKLWVPLSPELSFGNGLAIMDTTSGAVTTVNMGPNSAASGNVRIPSIGIDDVVVAVTLLDGINKTNALMRYSASGTRTWSSLSQNENAIDQPHPLVDPFTQQIYLMSCRGKAPDPSVAFICVYGTNGAPCNGWPVNGVAIPDSLGGYPINWVFSGVIVPNSNLNGVSRIIYSTTAEPQGANPSGCLIALSPANGAVLDSFCIARDPSSVVFLSSAPVIQANARGSGAHTLYVSQWDFTIFAFDPMNLAGGPLYSVNPMLPGERGTVAADFLALSNGGSLVMSGWRDDDNEYVVIAIPNIANNPNSGSNKPTGISPAGAAGAAVGTIAGVAIIGIAVAAYMNGGLMPGLAAIKNGVMSVIPSGSGASYGKVATATSSSSGGYGAASASYSNISSSSGSSGYH